MSYRRLSLIAVSFLASTFSALATTHTFTAGGTLSKITSLDRVFRHVRPGAKWSITVTYDDASGTNSSIDPTIGIWNFSQPFVTTIRIGQWTLTNTAGGITMVHRNAQLHPPYDGFSMVSEAIIGTAVQSMNLDLRSTNPIFNSISLPIIFPAIASFDLQNSFTFTRILPSGLRGQQTIEIFAGTVAYASVH